MCFGDCRYWVPNPAFSSKAKKAAEQATQRDDGDDGEAAKPAAAAPTGPDPAQVGVWKCASQPKSLKTNWVQRFAAALPACVITAAMPHPPNKNVRVCVRKCARLSSTPHRPGLTRLCTAAPTIP